MKKLKTYSRKDVHVHDSDPWFCLTEPEKLKQTADFSCCTSGGYSESRSSCSDLEVEICNPLPQTSSAVLFETPKSADHNSIKLKKAATKLERHKLIKKTKPHRQILKRNAKVKCNHDLNFSEIDKYEFVVESLHNRNNKYVLNKADKNKNLLKEDSVNSTASSSCSQESVLLEENLVQTNICHRITKNPDLIQSPSSICTGKRGKTIGLERTYLQNIENMTDSFPMSANINMQQQSHGRLSSAQPHSSAALYPSRENANSLSLRCSSTVEEPHCSTPLGKLSRKLSIPLSSVKSKTYRTNRQLNPMGNCRIELDHTYLYPTLCHISEKKSARIPDFSAIHLNEGGTSSTMQGVLITSANAHLSNQFDAIIGSSKVSNKPCKQKDNEVLEGISKKFRESNQLAKQQIPEAPQHGDDGASQSTLSSVRLNCRRLSVQRIIDLDSNKVHTSTSEKSKQSNSRAYGDHVSLLAGFFDISSDNSTAKEKILRVCEQEDIILFSEAYDWKSIKTCSKIGEGSYGEVYALNAVNGKRVVIKVIPIEGDFSLNNAHQKTFDEIFSEIVISKCLSEMRNSNYNQTRNFVKLNRAKLLKGHSPNKLLPAWEKFKKNFGSGSANPSIYPASQLYLVLEFDHGGLAVQSFGLKNPVEAKSVFYQVACTLAIAEEEYSFEHRDLHIENILISRTRMKNICYIFNGEKFQFPTHGVLATIIDFTLSRISDKEGVIFSDLNSEPSLFEGEGDYQFAIYRMIKEYVGNNWSKFTPYSNVLWLHYLSKKLCGYKYLRASAKSHVQALEFLDQMERNILQYECGVEVMKELNGWGSQSKN